MRVRQLFWLYPLAAAATYYSGLLRATEETDKRTGRSAAASSDRGLAVKIVSEVSCNKAAWRAATCPRC